jgi:hypothetical protein
MNDPTTAWCFIHHWWARQEHKNSLFPGCEVKWDSWNEPKPEGSLSTHCRASKSQGLKLIDKIKIISSQWFQNHCTWKKKDWQVVLQHRQAHHILHRIQTCQHHTRFLKTEYTSLNSNWRLPWSKSSPRGLDELVRLACFPSTASKVYINTIPCKLKKWKLWQDISIKKWSY